MIEILILNLRPGTRDKFHELFSTQSLPLQTKWNIHVVEHGPSLHDETSYYVIRAFASLEDREKSEDAFYSSDDWRHGPRTAMLDLIDSSAYAVVTPETLQHWTNIIKSKSLS